MARNVILVLIANMNLEAHVQIVKYLTYTDAIAAPVKLLYSNALPAAYGGKNVHGTFPGAPECPNVRN